MKAKFVFENLNFEKEKDPKASMDIGLRVTDKILKISYGDYYKEGYKHNMTDDLIDKVLSDPFWEKYLERDYGFVVKNGRDEEYLMLDDLISIGLPVLYKDKIYPMKKLEESNFERGKSVQDAINVGLKSQFPRFGELLGYYEDLKERGYDLSKIMTYNSSDSNENLAGFLIQDNDKFNDILLINKEKILLQHIIKKGAGEISIATTPEINSLGQILSYIEK